MKKKRVKIEEAIGTVLFHDVTGIDPGVFKGPVFRKGHKVVEEDIPRFLDLGKEHLWVIEMASGEIHEEDAARRMSRAFAGDNIGMTHPKEGRVDLKSEVSGVLRVKKEVVFEINSVGDLMLATLHDLSRCREGTTVAGTRIIPLVTGKERIRKVEEICRRRGPVLKVCPYRRLSWGLVITGNEIYHGRIKDGFEPIMETKASEFGCEIVTKTIVPDDSGRIAAAIRAAKDAGAELILVTGGMSVDPDDVTPSAIRAAGVSVERYGSPILPGAMLLLGYMEEIPILGIPACAVHSKRTSLDRILPLILIGERLTGEDIAKMGHGGLCLACPECRFPACPFAV